MGHRLSGTGSILKRIATAELIKQPGSVKEVLDQIANQVLLAGVILYPPILASYIYRVIKLGWRNILVIQVLLYLMILLLFVLRKKTSLTFRSIVLLGIIFIAGYMGTYTWGILGAGITTLIVACIFTAIIFGDRAGYATLAVSFAVISAIAFGYITGRIDYTFDVAAHSTSAAGWIIKLLILPGAVFIIVLSFSKLYSHLLQTISRLEERASELEESKEKLENEIAERKKIEEQLIHAQKMDAIGRLAGGVAHDFNNQLMVILGFSTLLSDKFDSGDPRLRDIRMIKAAGEHASGLTQQLLAFCHKQIIEPKRVDLNRLISDLKKMLGRLIGEDIDVKINTDPKPAWVNADPVQIEQVIVNMAVNARDAMPGGGKLVIDISNVIIDEDFANSHLEISQGPYVMISVSDTGHGMDKETMSRIYEPFFTTKGLGKGTGLGLSTTYGIVKQSGGNIFTYSEPGKGATFKIYLPADDKSLDEGSGKAENFEMPRGAGNVLVVEDDPLVRMTVAHILADNGYSVQEATSGEEALELFQKTDSDIKLLITDVIMPGINGKELAEKCMAHSPGIKVLYISGYTDDVIAHHGGLDGKVSLLQKPFTPRALLIRVGELLEQ